jgi:hypothetical protein
MNTAQRPRSGCRRRCSRWPAEGAGHQSDVGGLDGHIGAGADREGDLGAGEAGGAPLRPNPRPRQAFPSHSRRPCLPVAATLPGRRSMASQRVGGPWLHLQRPAHHIHVHAEGEPQNRPTPVRDNSTAVRSNAGNAAASSKSETAPVRCSPRPPADQTAGAHRIFIDPSQPRLSVDNVEHDTPRQKLKEENK